MNSAEPLIAVRPPANAQAAGGAGTFWRNATPLARFNYLMATVLGLLVVAEVCLSPVVHYPAVWGPIGVLPLFLPFAFVAWYGHGSNHPRTRDLLLCGIWTFVVIILAAPLVKIAGLSPFPLVDGALARIDAYTIRTVTIVQWLKRIPGLPWLSDAVYAVLSPALALAPLILANLCRQPNVARRYIFSSTVAVVLTAALFAILPAAGPWTVEDFRPTESQAAAESSLLDLKSPHPHLLATQTAAIVSFPSFHTILSILAALAVWRFRRVRVFALVVCAAVCISTVTTGWHYLIDVAGGIAVAVFAWAVAVRLIHDPAETGFFMEASG